MSDLDRLVAGLCRPGAYPHPADRVEHIETHISHVLLAGDYAYKLKKPLNLGFLDFSTLARRRFCCAEEIRLNARLAPQIYLEVVAVTGTPDRPYMGGEGEALEYAVKMRRFDQDALLTRLPVTPQLADRIAERVARFHDRIPAASDETPFGTPAAVSAPMEENFTHIRACRRDPAALARLLPLEAWTQARLAALRPALEGRRRAGRIRECHGDMHRGNIALVEGEVVIFDGIEFNPDLRWIDTMSEVAFLVMDLEEAGQQGAARRLLNRYLELTGDYAGLAVLDLYQVYRALVRAKVTAIRLDQPNLEAAEAARDRDVCKRYLALAEGYTQPRPRCLSIACGVSGSGKSHLAAALRERLPLIHIRSDIERKRLFGLSADARTGSGQGGGIYTAEVGERTYAQLLSLASLVLAAGYSPLVDATFLKEAQRRPFLALAADLGCPCHILELTAPRAVLRARVAARQAQGRDPSEAGLAVLASQLAAREPLTAAERRLALHIDTTHPLALEDIAAALAGTREASSGGPRLRTQ